jgi:hypothetical protein
MDKSVFKTRQINKLELNEYLKFKPFNDFYLLYVDKLNLDYNFEIKDFTEFFNSVFTDLYLIQDNQEHLSKYLERYFEYRFNDLLENEKIASLVKDYLVERLTFYSQDIRITELESRIVKNYLEFEEYLPINRFSKVERMPDLLEDDLNENIELTSKDIIIRNPKHHIEEITDEISKITLSNRDQIIDAQKWIDTNILSFSDFEQKLIYMIEDLKTKVNDLEQDNTENSHLNFNGIEKVILMIELGIIDFLKENKNFKGSVNKMALFLSKITGDSPSALQTPLNSYISDNKSTNPMIKTKNGEDRVSKYLVSKSYQK